MGDTLIHWLYNFYRNIVRTSLLPLEWKSAKIIPVFKKSSQTKVEKYRPVGFLHIGSKIFEKIIFKRILDIYAHHTQERQYGFKTGRSPISKLLMTLSEIYSNIQNV